MAIYFNGFNVVMNEYLTVPGEPQLIKRTWKQRLFTRPWRPLVKFEAVSFMCPSREIYVQGDTLIMHPAMFEEVKKAVELKGATELFASPWVQH